MKKRKIILIGSLIVIVSIIIITFFYLSTQKTKEEKECFRSVEWFPTATEALNWSLNEAPKRVESFSLFIFYDYGIYVTRHEIFVRPTEKYNFGYDVILIFYGIVE